MNGWIHSRISLNHLLYEAKPWYSVYKLFKWLFEIYLSKADEVIADLYIVVILIHCHL